jgi:hypothetical protein
MPFEYTERTVIDVVDEHQHALACSIRTRLSTISRSCSDHVLTYTFGGRDVDIEAVCTDYRTFVTLLFTASVDTGATASTQPRPGHRYIDRRQPGPTAVEICAGIHLLAFPELGYPVSEAVKGTGITTVHVPTERPDIPKEISYARPAQRPSLRIWLRRWVFTGPGSPLPKSCHQPSRPPPDMAARPDPRPMAPMSPIGALGPTTARRSAVLMLGGLPAPTILEWF